uniref:Uncharacterized protein n=1 Tax=Ditylenchus dipsaci TaxID=166011 RepID=A0A915ES56_9BILA
MKQKLITEPSHFIVAAYYSLGCWLCAAPQLAEIESSLSTVAQIIEFGMTGGKGLTPENYKPASQRVRDAAENLLETLFSDLKKISRNSTFLAIDDEANLMKKFGKEDISLENFQYFLLGESTIVGLHEAQHIHVISNGLPTVLAVFRTPFHRQHSTYFQLLPKTCSEKNGQPDAQSPGSCSVTSEKSKAETSASGEESKEQSGMVQFEFPPGINKPQCKLDAEFQPLDAMEPIPEGAGSAVGDRDSRNVWIQSSLGAFLSQPPKPEDPVSKCNSLRVFLYDMGLINRNAFGKQLIPLNTVNMDFFRQSLHFYVDRAPVKLLETVSMFYVRDGQRTAAEILNNNTKLQATSGEFCSLMCALGKAVDVESHAHWTGHWETAFLGEKVKKKSASQTKQNHYTLDGITNALWWANNQIEVAYVLPTEHSKRASKIALANGADQANGTKLLFSQTSKQLSSQSFKLPNNLLQIAETHHEPTEKEDMLVFRPRPSSPFPLDSKSRETYINESFEQLSALEEEYRRLSAAVNHPEDSTPTPDSKENLLRAPLPDSSRRLSHGPQISTFNLFTSLSPISLLVDEEVPAPPKPKPMLHSLISQLSTDSGQSNHSPKTAGSGPGTPQPLDLVVPSYTTTIITASTNTMSMMQATAIVVRSARFSPIDDNTIHPPPPRRRAGSGRRCQPFRSRLIPISRNQVHLLFFLRQSLPPANHFENSNCPAHL